MGHYTPVFYISKLAPLNVTVHLNMTFADLAAAATKDKEFAKEKKETVEEEEGGDDENNNEDVEAAPDVHFTPIVKLEHVETKTLEEDEVELFKMRSKMFRFDKETNEWKERGTGEVRLLQHPTSKKVRLVMRRDQTLKVCANHMVTHEITLRPNVGSDRSWVYSVLADVSDGEAKPELFAIRFGNPENANLFKSKFEECQKLDRKETSENEEASTTTTAEKPKETQVESVQKSLESVTLCDSKKEENQE